MYSIINKKEIDTFLSKELSQFKVNPSNKTIKDMYVSDRFTIAVYNSNTLLINGELEDRIYTKLLSIVEENKYLGCDEVGVGDFFGPTVYCSVRLDQEIIKKLSTSFINIKDSKKFKDEEIMDVYSKLKSIVDYQVEVVFDKDIDNLNSIEQKMIYHNKNTLKFNNVDTCVIDLFTTENSFNKYTQKYNLKWNDNLILETKADSKFYSVAIASIIARGVFLEEMDKLNKKYDMIFPLGSVNVKKTASEFIKRYSKEELATFAKTSFKTFDEI